MPLPTIARVTGPAAHFRLLWEYNTWANARVIVQAGKVGERDYYAGAPGLSFGSLHATLVHVLVAEIIWLARWSGDLPPQALKDARKAAVVASRELPTLAVVRDRFAAEQSRQARFVSALIDEDVWRPVAYKTLDGQPTVQPLAEQMAHVLNHGTQFRSEAAVRLTQLGQSPGDVDLIIFIRERDRD